MNTDPKKLLALYQPKEVTVLKPDRQLCIVRFSPCGKLLAAGGCDATVRRWDASRDDLTELPPLTGHNGWVQALAFSPLSPGGRGAGGEGTLFTADTWGALRCWPYGEKEAQPVWAVNSAHDGWIRKLAVSPDGNLLATCGADQKVCLWSTQDGKKVRELSGHGEDVFAVAFHLDGKSLVSGDLKGIVRHWDLASGRCVRRLDAGALYLLHRIQEVGGVRCLAFDRAGKILACAGCQPKSGGFVQGTPLILLFDWQSGKLLHTLKGAGDTEGFVHDLHFHPAGFLMAVTSGQPGNGRFFFQRPNDAKPFFLWTKMANCHSLAVHPDGRRLAVAATNANSAGNGRQLKGGEYPGNWSPVHVWEMPKQSE